MTDRPLDIARAAPMRRVALWFAAMFVASVPIEGAAVIPALGALSRILGALSAVVLLLAIVVRGRVRRPAPFHVAAGLFCCWAVLSLAWSDAPGASLGRAGTYVQLLAMTVVVWEVGGGPGAARRLLSAYVFGAAVAAVVVVANFLSGRAWAAYEARYVAFGTDPNELGLTLALGIPIAWWCSVAAPRSPARTLYRLYVPLALLAIGLTASRTAMVCAVLGLLAVLALFRRLRLAERAAVAVGILATGWVLTAVVPVEAWARLGRIREELGTLNNRAGHWTAGVHAYGAHPVRGAGAGSFATVVADGGHERAAAHNSFLAVAVELGAIGLGLFLAMLGCAAYTLRHFSGPARQMWVVVILTGVAGASTLSWDYRKPMWLLPAILVTFAAQERRRSTEGSAPGELVAP